MSSLFEKNNPKIIKAWCMYDWANSAFSLVIISTIFPGYFNGIVKNEQGGDIINFLGIDIKNSALFSFSISFAFLITALLSPILSSVADYSGKKKRFMQMFSTIGAVSCLLLFFFNKDTITTGVFTFIVATIGFSGSIVFYNSYLPDLVTEDQMDTVSAKGFSLGYIGSVLLFILNIVLFFKPDWFGGITPGEAARVSFVSVGIWWLVFAQYSFYHLPIPQAKTLTEGQSVIWAGLHELKLVWIELKKLKLLRKFLFAFFFYSTGVQTVMYVASIFGEKELHIKSDHLMIVILILQIVAIIGAIIFAKVSEKQGNIKALIIIVLVWIGICVAAYFTQTEFQFFVLAGFVGFVMGGVQSLSRSTYAKLIPDNTNDTTSYFSFYDILEKLSIVLGTFSYGLIDFIFHNMRYSTIALIVYFIIGLTFLFNIHSKKLLQPLSK